MAHLFESATSGRAKCRGCGGAIGKGELRFGERLPNPFGEGEMTLWFHPACAMYKRPEPLLEALAAADAPVEDAERLEAGARRSLAHRRLPRLDGTERAPSGRARCRSCREPIAKDAWRISLVFYEEGRFEPGGFIHVACAPAYFETADILDRVRHFSRLSETEIEEIARELDSRAG
jgi:hypothetical protein